MPVPERGARWQTEFDHHGDKAIPGQQRFGAFARSLMSGLGMPIRNRTAGGSEALEKLWRNVARG